MFLSFVYLHVNNPSRYCTCNIT